MISDKQPMMMNTKKWKIIASVVFCITLVGFTLVAQNKSFTADTVKQRSKLNGTWRLVTSEVITNGKTTVTFPVKGQEMIKMFNDTDFSFFKHDINKGKDKDAIFEAGSGTYTLRGSVYKEHLLFCTARDWEKHDFTFNLTVKKDTLVQRGVEKIDSLNINHEIVETYVRIKK